MTAVHRAGGGAERLTRAWRTLAPERRLAAGAALGLFVTLFLPWYQETVVAVGRSASATVTGWQAFSFAEAAVLLVAAGVLTLLFARAEGRAFHVPGGDGWAITAAGFWTGALIVWRIFDKQTVRVRGPGTELSGVEWGIFVALAIAALLAYAGSRVRAAHAAEPPLPGEPPAARAAAEGNEAADAATRRPAAPAAAAGAARTSGLLERPPGWLTAPPRQGQNKPRAPDDQLTIPLEDEPG
jgi:hypothetical protein